MNSIIRFVSFTFISLIMIVALIIITGCDESGGITIPSGSTEITVSAKSDESLTDAIVITEAKAIISEVKFEQETNQNNQTITFSPFVVNFALSGSLKEMTTNYMIRDFYTKIKFQVHKPENNETPSDPEFVSGSERYSFIVKGTFNGSGFVYKSKISSNIVLSFGKTENFNLAKTHITVAFNELGWFKNGSAELDPNNPQNASLIDNNIKNSFKQAFLDNDRNGLPD